MSTRNLVAVVIAAAVTASATTVVCQMALGSDAHAAAGNANSQIAQQIHHQNQTFAKELSVESQILAQVKGLRKSTEASFATLNASAGKVATNTANIDKNAADTLVPLNGLAADGHLLVDSAPSSGGPYAVSLADFSGFVPRMLDVMDHFCSNAQITRYGNGGDAGTVIGC